MNGKRKVRELLGHYLLELHDKADDDTRAAVDELLDGLIELAVEATLDRLRRVEAGPGVPPDATGAPPATLPPGGVGATPRTRDHALAGALESLELLRDDVQNAEASRKGWRSLAIRSIAAASRAQDTLAETNEAWSAATGFKARAVELDARARELEVRVRGAETERQSAIEALDRAWALLGQSSNVRRALVRLLELPHECTLKLEQDLCPHCLATRAFADITAYERAAAPCADVDGVLEPAAKEDL